MKKFTFASMVLAFLFAANAFGATTNVVNKQTNSVSKIAIVNPVPAEAWVIGLNGVGSTVTKGDTTSAFGAEVTIGRNGHLLFPVEAGIRQGVSYSSGNGGSTVLSTKVYSDWTVVSYKRLDLFGGANIGLQYGNTPLTWTASPEVGARYWVKKDVAVVGRAEYPFDLVTGKNDTLRYSLGFAVSL